MVYVSVEIMNGLITDVLAFNKSEDQDKHEEKWLKDNNIDVEDRHMEKFQLYVYAVEPQ